MFGGGLAITSLPLLDEGAVGIVGVAVGAAGFAIGALGLYGVQLRRTSK